MIIGSIMKMATSCLLTSIGECKTSYVTNVSNSSAMNVTMGVMTLLIKCYARAKNAKENIVMTAFQ